MSEYNIKEKEKLIEREKKGEFKSKGETFIEKHKQELRPFIVPSFKLTLKTSDIPKYFQILTPHLKNLRLHLIRHIITLSDLQQIPSVKTLPPLSPKSKVIDIRVSPLASIALKESVVTPPRFKAVSPRDISLRPTLSPEMFRGISKPFFPTITLKHLMLRRPQYINAPTVRCITLLPKLHLMQAAEKEVTLYKEALEYAAPVTEAETEALEKEPDFYELFLEGGLGELTITDRPVCIILPRFYPESYANAIALICREVYRIKKGGKPSPCILSSGNKEEIERLLEAGGRIFVIDDSICELFDFSNRKAGQKDIKKIVDWEQLYNRLRELFSQDYGFVIFHIDEWYLNDFENKIKEVSYMIPKLLVIRPKFRTLSPQVKAEISRLCWGFVESKGETFDDMFCNAEKIFYNKLEEISKDTWLMHCAKPNRAGPESMEHRLLKALIIKIIAKERGIKREDIPEKILAEESSVGFVVDIFIKESRECVEIETLYGTGFNPIDKIDHETLKKYAEFGAARVVKIVMLPLHLLTYLRSLINLKEIYERKRINIEFYTVDVQNERLVPLKEIIGRLGELKKQILRSKEQ